MNQIEASDWSREKWGGGVGEREGRGRRVRRAIKKFVKISF